MEATYNGRKVYVFYVSRTRDQYVLASYHEAETQMFKINVSELTDVSESLRAEINRESF